MSWADLGEVVKAIGAIITAGAACVGVTIAWKGLEKWKIETVGKRKAELAALVLADFYEMEEIFRVARSPFIMVDEMSAMDGVPDEVASNSKFAPERRLSQHQDFFARVRSRKHEFSAIFGREASAPFDEIWQVRLDINHAVDDMLRHKEIERARDADNRTLWLSWYNVAFRNSDESKDPILPRIRSAIDNIELICRPAIDAVV